MNRDEYIYDKQVVKRACSAVKLAIEKKQTLGVPVIVYDRKTGNICDLKENGSVDIVTSRTKRERYSERVAKQ